MTARLLSPGDAAETIAKQLSSSWAERVLAELNGDSQPKITCRLRPGVSGTASVQRIGFDVWHEWRMGWKAIHLQDLDGVDGVRLTEADVRVAGHPTPAPLLLEVDNMGGGVAALDRLGAARLTVDIQRARRIGERFRAASAILTPSTLRSAYRLSDSSIDVLVGAVTWLQAHDDLGDWTIRQLQIPGMHTKWLDNHRSLLRALTGRDLAAETRPRLSVAHFTYADPAYLATGGRHHDAWTAGDSHTLAYAPRCVLIVENRDSRLWFPDIDGTIVVEGSGKAAATSLGGIHWITQAERVIYWGDIDADGFAILDNLRASLAPSGVKVESMLMDERTRARYAQFGVNYDKRGELLKPSSQRLPNLTPEEAAAYAGVATAGEALFRRIEQERIPSADALAELQDLLAG